MTDTSRKIKFEVESIFGSDLMLIPSVPAETLHAALTHFDLEYRDAPDWAGWESNKAHLYAIEHAGQRYPVNQIVSMATGLPVSDFSGGQSGYATLAQGGVLRVT
jgi:hypothetical protein